MSVAIDERGNEYISREYEFEEVAIFWTSVFYLCCGVAAIFSPAAAAMFGIASYMIFVYLLPVCALLAAWIYAFNVKGHPLGIVGQPRSLFVFGIWSFLILAIETMVDSITIMPHFLPTLLLKNISTRVDYSSSNPDVPSADGVSYHVDDHLLCGLASFPLLETLVQMDMKYKRCLISRHYSALYIVFMYFIYASCIISVKLSYSPLLNIFLFVSFSYILRGTITNWMLVNMDCYTISVFTVTTMMVYLAIGLVLYINVIQLSSHHHGNNT